MASWYVARFRRPNGDKYQPIVWAENEEHADELATAQFSTCAPHADDWELYGIEEIVDEGVSQGAEVETS